MDEKVKLEWGRRLTGELFEKWPKDENGEPVDPVFRVYVFIRTTVTSVDLFSERAARVLKYMFRKPCMRTLSI